MADGGKGSGRRPSQVPEKVLEDNWARIFGKKPAKNDEPKREENGKH